MYLVFSSVKVRKYSAPPRDFSCIFPHTSECTSSRALRGTAGKWATMMLSTNTGLAKTDCIIVKLFNKFQVLFTLCHSFSVLSFPATFMNTVFQVVEIANACGESNFFSFRISQPPSCRILLSFLYWRLWIRCMRVWVPKEHCSTCTSLCVHPSPVSLCLQQFLQESLVSLLVEFAVASAP